MKAILKTFAIILLVLSGAAVSYFYMPVSHSAHFQENEEITVLVYDGGSIEKEIVIPPHSDLHTKLNDWLRSNSDGWNHSLVTYIPGIYFRSKGVGLNILGHGAIVNYEQWSSTGHTQIVKDLNTTRLKDELLQGLL